MAEKKDDISKDAAANLQKAAKALATVSDKMAKVFAKGADFAKAMTSEVNETAKGAKTAQEYFDGITNLNKDLASQLEKNAEQQKIQNNALATGNSIAVATLTIEKERAIQQAIADGMAQSMIDKLEDQYDAAIQMTTEYEKQVAEQEAAEKLAEENLAHTEALKNKLKEITGYQGVFAEIFTDGRAAAGIFLNQVAKGMKKTTELFDHARHEGMTVSQAFHETSLAISDSFSLTGASAKDSMEVMSGMRAEMGTLEGHTRKARLEAASLAKSFGISNEEAGKLTASLSMMPGATMDTANDTARFAANMAKAAGAAPGEVLQDMAKNQEAFAKYGKDGGKNMATMAVAAKKIGMEMGPLVDMTESLLDFENSIEKQMEASVLLGREINLDKARQLALEGDLAGATKEVLANVGGEAEFNKMNQIQRQALADSMGVSVGELQKMVKNQDKLNDLSEDQQAALEAGEVTMDELMANAGGFMDKLKGAAITAFSLVKGFSTLKKGAQDIAEFAKTLGIESFKQLKNVIKTGIAKGVNFAKQAAQWVAEKAHWAWKMATQSKFRADQAKALKEGLQGIKDKAKAMLTGGADKVKGATEKVTGGVDKAKKLTEKVPEGVDKNVEKVADSAGGAMDKTADASKKADKQPPLKNFKTAMANLREGLQEFGKQPGKTLKGVAVLVGAGALLGIGLAAIAMGVKAMGGSPKDMIDVGIALVLFAGSMFLMSKSLGKISPSAVLKGSLALAVLGAALIPAAFAFSLLKGVDVGSIIAFSIALPLLGLAAAGLGFLIIPIAMGAAALGLLGVGLIAVAASMMMFAAAGDGTTALQEFLGTFAENPTIGVSLMGAAAGMFIFSGALFALAIASFFGAPALIALGAGMLALGIGVKFASEGLASISESLPEIADGVGALGAVAPMLAVASLFIMQLGIAGLVSAPGIFVGAAALGFMTIAMAGFAAAVTAAIPGVTLLLQLGSMADSFALIAESMFAMAAGITAFAMAGLLTLPTIMGLIALSFVAPILTLLGDSINYDLGGGSSVETKPEDAKMDMLIEEVRQLRAAFQTPGVINMDGQKVGDVIGLAVSTSGVA